MNRVAHVLAKESLRWNLQFPNTLYLTRLPSKEHLRCQQTRKLFAYRESTHMILRVTCLYSKCNTTYAECGQGECRLSRGDRGHGTGRCRRDLKRWRVQTIAVAHDDAFASREGVLFEPQRHAPFGNGRAGEVSANERNLYATLLLLLLLFS